MRIIGGQLRGRKLKVPATGLRPTTDRVREALFNILGPLSGYRVADLYAGSGAFGLEALSRGAAAVEFIEKNPRSCAVIRQNLAAIGVSGGSVRCQPARRFLAAEPPDGGYDLIFMDPPYHAESEKKMWREFSPGRFLAPEGTLVAEFAADETPPPLPGLEIFDQRRYGGTGVVFYHRAGTDRMEGGG